MATRTTRIDRLLGIGGFIVGGGGIGVWVVYHLVEIDKPGRPAEAIDFVMFGLVLFTLAAVILLAIRHFVAHRGGSGGRWLGWGCGAAVLAALFMALTIEPLVTEGDWREYINTNYGGAPPILLAALGLTGCGIGLLLDLRTRPVTEGR